MTDHDLDNLLSRFRRDLFFADGVRWSVMATLFGCAFGVMVSEDEVFRRTALLSVLMILIGAVILAMVLRRKAEPLGGLKAFKKDISGDSS